MRSPGFYEAAPPSALQGGAGRTFVSGYYYTSMNSGGDTTAAMTQSFEYCVRFETSETRSFDRIGLEITTGVATAVVRLGIRYDSGSGAPGALLLDAGTIDASSAAVGEITVSRTLTPGRWWLTATLQTTTGVSCRARAVDAFLGASTTATGNSSSYGGTGRTGALPAAMGSFQPSGAGPKVLLRAV
jgi:hypothetical protein